MNIYYIQKFWFGERHYADTGLHKHYHTVELPRVNIDAQIWLTILGPGINFDAGLVGLAAAGVKSFQFIDQDGIERFQEFSTWESHLRVEQCTAVTFAFHVQLAWAKAEGIIYWHD